MWPTKEQQLILSLLRFSLRHESPENTIRILSEETDWDRVAVMAEYHGISPIIYDSLLRNKEIPIPDQVKENLAREYIANSAMILLYERALKGMIRHFRQNGLSFVIHKGLGLAALLYPGPELRPCGGDFDVLIHLQDYPKAKALLEEIGYELDNIHYEQHEMSYIGEVKLCAHEGDLSAWCKSMSE